MGKIDLKDKRNVYAIVISLLIMAAAHLVYNYIWDPFVYQRESLERDLQSAQAELDKINAKKHRVAELEMQLVQAEKDFEKLKEMFPEEEKVPLRLQDLYSVLRSSGVQIQKFNPEGQSEKEHYKENRYSIAVNSGYHMLGYLFAEIANFNYPTSISNLKLSRYSGIKAEIEKAETHGWTPITMSVSFNLTTYTSKKVGK
jgi:type IV pilus assembly protein PilO